MSCCPAVITTGDLLILAAAKEMVSRKGNFQRADDFNLATTAAREKRVMGINFVMSVARKIMKIYQSCTATGLGSSICHAH